MYDMMLYDPQQQQCFADSMLNHLPTFYLVFVLTPLYWQHGLFWWRTSYPLVNVPASTTDRAA